MKDDKLGAEGCVRVSGDKDREEMIRILSRNGYKSWNAKRRLNGKSNYTYFVRYELTNNYITDEEVEKLT